MPELKLLKKLEYDGKFTVALGKSRMSLSWRNTEMTWSDLLLRLSKSRETYETHKEFMAMKKDKQDNIKDIGGFVGGSLRDGRRQNKNVIDRQLITLDIDTPPKGFWDDLLNNLSLDCALAIYSTHKYTPEKPRLRLIIPLDRKVDPDEYQAIARRIAGDMGMEMFDGTTFQPERLMYWPSHSRDVEPFFESIDAPFLCADEVLGRYDDWRDASFWPVHPSENSARLVKSGEKQDPREAKGLVGAFCRTWTVSEAIAEFIPEVYTATNKEDRYTYAAGSSFGGLVIYNDLLAWSNHSTDPAQGRSRNAYDLIRVHKFGDLDDDNGDEKASKAAMDAFVLEDKSTLLTLARERQANAVLDFGNPVEPAGDDSWKTSLKPRKDGSPDRLLVNAVLILENDPAIQGIRFNELSGFVEVDGRLPWTRPDKYWRNADSDQLYSWIASNYEVQFPDAHFQKAFSVVTDKRRFNPLRDYIDGLPEWDGVERVDRLLVKYLGAEDKPYVRAVTRKTLIGAIQRVLHPGCKFDTVLVLDGKPGIGKSTFLRKLGGDWFSDSLSLADTRDKTGAEKLQGVWIMEVGEMQGARKADVDALKGFISRQDDTYRPAYARAVERHPRSCIICGTTNSTTGFLRDTTGNRRFWPVMVEGGGEGSVWDLTQADIDQIWAEAKVYTLAGEDSFLDKEMEAEAAKAQQEALIYDEREADVRDYLDTLLPEDWYKRGFDDRVDYFQSDFDRSEGTMQRTHVCVAEIFCECFGRPKNQLDRKESNEIIAIMARIPGWDRPENSKARDTVYGRQRVFRRL